MALRLLIADDSATNRLLFSTTAARMGHHADVAATGREAIDMFHESRYDIVFLDLNMPGLDGIATAREIRALNARHTPVFGVSGFIDGARDEEIAAAGMRACLLKPLDREKLAEAIRACKPAGPEPGQETAPPDSLDIDIGPGLAPQRLMSVYAQELRARAEACLRYLRDEDRAALLREAHTLRALADMLKTPDVRQAAALLEESCAHRIPPRLFSLFSRRRDPLPGRVRGLSRACHQAAQAIERRN